MLAIKPDGPARCIRGLCRPLLRAIIAGGVERARCAATVLALIWPALKRFAVERLALEWFALGWFALGWFALGWFGLEWFGLEWFGLEWFGLARSALRPRAVPTRPLRSRTVRARTVRARPVIARPLTPGPALLLRAALRASPIGAPLSQARAARGRTMTGPAGPVGMWWFHEGRIARGPIPAQARPATRSRPCPPPARADAPGWSAPHRRCGSVPSVPIRGRNRHPRPSGTVIARTQPARRAGRRRPDVPRHRAARPPAQSQEYRTGSLHHLLAAIRQRPMRCPRSGRPTRVRRWSVPRPAQSRVRRNSSSSGRIAAWVGAR